MNEPPNILLITSDQQHWNTIGKHFPEIKTPNLDRLADEGMLFRRAYCPNPTCTPTRASLITGLQPSRHGAWSLGTKLPENTPTIGQHLASAGYATTLVGKAHFQPLLSTGCYPSLESYPILHDTAFWKKYHGPFYGFDHIEIARNHGDEAHVGQHYALWLEENGFADWRRHFRNTWGPYDFTDGSPAHPPQHGAWTLPEQAHMNAWITSRSAALIDQSRAARKPFFLWASYFDPHPPYLVPEPWASMYDPRSLTIPRAAPGEHDDSPSYIRATQTLAPDFSKYQETPYANHGLHTHLHDPRALARDIALYYGMISMLDHYVGKLLEHLDATGQTQNTLVVFTSDHGHYYGHHGLIAKGPFHYEDGIRVPMIARWPGHIAPGTETGAIQSLIDLPATLLRAARLPVPGSMQGLDQLPLWTGQTRTPVRNETIVEFRHQPTTIHMKTLVENRYKITIHYRRDYGELYDLQTDPGEIRNLWDAPGHASLKAALIRRLLDAEMAAEPMWMPRIANA
jgi:uncharacterized sulfatase